MRRSSGPGRQLLGEMIAEAIGVLIIVAFGDSAAAMYYLYDPSPYQHAYWGVAIAWGLAVSLAIYVSSSVSGAHVNPAVTLAMAMYRRFPWRKTVPYVVAQVVGGLVGGALVYALFAPVIEHYNHVHHLARATGGAAKVFFTHPGKFVSPLHAFSDQIIETGFLVLAVFAITEQYNDMAPKANSGALIIGLVVAIIGASMGYLEAWAINPARDLGPRIFAWMAGWGASALPAPHDFWWIPIAGPLLGGAIGAGLYQYLIHPFLPMPRSTASGNGASPEVSTETPPPDPERDS